MAMTGAERSKLWRLSNPEKIKEIRKRYYESHKEKARAYDKRYSAKYPYKSWSIGDKLKNRSTAESSRLRREYGITQEIYNEMFLAQNGLCYVCEQPETAKMNGNPMKLCVDHDHISGKVRKLLCHSCNTALGKLKDDPTIIRKLANYVEEHHDL